MKSLWNYIDQKNWTEGSKYRITLIILSILFSTAGLLTWLVIRIWALQTFDWMLCFVGYPILIAILVLFFYSINHQYHDGSFYY